MIDDKAGEAIGKLLVQKGKELRDQHLKPFAFTNDEDADRLLNDLAAHPHAFVLASIMNRQIKAERAFIIPYELSKKLGDFTMPTLLRLKETDVRGLMKNPKPLHRHFEKMAGVLFKAIQFIGQRYNSDVSQIWRNKPSSATVVYRFLEFDGVGPILFGTQIAAGGFYRGFT